MIQNSPAPIVMVGSQRSSDRPSSDAALNLIHSVTTAAKSDIAEVMVCMFGPTSDLCGLLREELVLEKCIRVTDQLSEQLRYSYCNC